MAVTAGWIAVAIGAVILTYIVAYYHGRVRERAAWQDKYQRMKMMVHAANYGMKK